MIINSKTKQTIWLIAVVVIFIFGFYLRLKPVFIRPIIFDEAFTVMYLNKYDKIIKLIEHDQSVPPLNYLLVKAMSQISTNLVWLRIPSVIFSMLGLFLAFKLALKFSKKVALLVLILLSFSLFQITYAWQAYVYSQLFFLGMAALYCFFNLLTEKNSKNENWQVVGLSVFSLLAFFTHYGFIWTIISFFIISFHNMIRSQFKFKAIPSKNKKLIIANLVILLGLLAYVPIFSKNFNQALININWFKKINFYTIGQSINTMLGFYDHFDQNNLLATNWIKILSTIIFSLMIIYLAKLREQKINYLIIISITNLLLPILCSLLITHQSIQADRTIIVASFTITMLFAICVEHLLQKKLFYCLFVLLLVISEYFFVQNYNRTQTKVFASGDTTKYYVDWFRTHQNFFTKKISLLLVDHEMVALHNNNESHKYVILDYYWQGYDGKAPLRDYDKVIIETDGSQEQNNGFYLLDTSGNNNLKIDQKLCPDQKKIPISKWSKNDKNSFNLYLYECNSTK